jgi:hypothetical protein
VEHHRRDDAVERQRCGHRDAVTLVLRYGIACTLADRRARTRESSRDGCPFRR